MLQLRSFSIGIALTAALLHCDGKTVVLDDGGAGPSPALCYGQRNDNPPRQCTSDAPICLEYEPDVAPGPDGSLPSTPIDCIAVDSKWLCDGGVTCECILAHPVVPLGCGEYPGTCTIEAGAIYLSCY